MDGKHFEKYGAFRKRSSNWRNLKTPALRLGVDGKHFANRAFSKTLFKPEQFECAGFAHAF